MGQEVTNFARFYTILKRVPLMGDVETTKREMVRIGTNDRTDSLKEMTCKEYNHCVTSLTRSFPKRETSIWSNAERDAACA